MDVINEIKDFYNPHLSYGIPKPQIGDDGLTITKEEIGEKVPNKDIYFKRYYRTGSYRITIPTKLKGRRGRFVGRYLEDKYKNSFYSGWYVYWVSEKTFEKICKDAS
ncbi:hypothetical protein [Thermoactinomyces sp. DSM 45892]|uniref:hypothetical protein n=1 Tax=Thermoactinomyces sp. DSM 45892 TaxID=1882753 RepID=UPI001160DA42|nr:hypothetical protein [Thermoactinomyces sp. DSM 45892]